VFRGNHKQVGYEGVHWIHVAHDQDIEVGFAYMMMKLHLLQLGDNHIQISE